MKTDTDRKEVFKQALYWNLSDIPEDFNELLTTLQNVKKEYANYKLTINASNWEGDFSLIIHATRPETNAEVKLRLAQERREQAIQAGILNRTRAERDKMEREIYEKLKKKYEAKQ